MFSSEDARLLAQPLPPLRCVATVSPVYAAGHGVMEYREAGTMDKPVLLLLHGIGSSSAGYRAQLAGLQYLYRVIAWNAPGFGESTPLADPQPDSGQYVEAALAFLRAIGVQRLAGLVGSSWGSVIAADFARSSDVPVGMLILSAPNTARALSQPEHERDAIRAATVKAGLASFGQDRSAIADKLLASNASPEVRAQTMRLRDAVTPGGWEQAMNMLFTVYTPKILPDVKAPVTLIVGREDKVAPESEHAAVLSGVRPDARLYTLDRVGHMPKLEAPSAFNEIVDRRIAWSEQKT
ncbi:alpha/beta fold hydrolase [Variovorax sp. Root411]|uniref:alpha/beta fold hydrolase n=1 Tax=Variovorax sp. Root411 TaxID=1736530 RepID=UPI000700E1B3|nr:alpha/beta hydrolase [Variovorax sp. Root411]KQW54573.1 hypothetical protein ASC92_21415 [Variovorax sp. Root411]